jgi:FAD binding domain
MTPPSADEIMHLAVMLRGKVILPHSNMREYQVELEYMHNACFTDRKPLMFVLCRDAGDVQLALAFATTHGLPVSVRGGGHSACGSSCRDGSVVIDLKDLHAIEYDPRTTEVTVDAGCTLADVNVALMRHNRMAPVGVVPWTGCGGLCLHGGIGLLSHRYGTSCDNITSMDLLLADGTMKHLDFDSTGDDKELFFAARGAASAVGIVTRFTLRTYPLETITGGLWLMEDDDRYSNTRKLIKKARDMVLEQDASGNRKLTGFIYYGNLPPDPGLDPERHHKPCTIVLAGAWGGDDEAAAMVSKLVDRDICIGKPPAPMPFNVLNQLMGPVFLTFPRLGAYYKGVMGHEVPDDRIDAAADLWATHDRAMGTSTVGLDFFGGRAGTEFGTAITAGGHDHCVSSLRNFTFGVPALVYFPNTPAMYEQGRDRRMRVVLFSAFDPRK